MHLSKFREVLIYHDREHGRLKNWIMSRHEKLKSTFTSAGSSASLSSLVLIPKHRRDRLRVQVHDHTGDIIDDVILLARSNKISNHSPVSRSASPSPPISCKRRERPSYRSSSSSSGPRPCSIGTPRCRLRRSPGTGRPPLR